MVKFIAFLVLVIASLVGYSAFHNNDMFLTLGCGVVDICAFVALTMK